MVSWGGRNPQSPSESAVATLIPSFSTPTPSPGRTSSSCQLWLREGVPTSPSGTTRLKDSLAPLSKSATSPSFLQVEMKQGGKNQKEKSLRFKDKKKITTIQQASDSESLPQAMSTTQEHILHFFPVSVEKRGQSTGSVGHRGDLEDPAVLSVGPLPPKGFSFTPHYTLDSWEHSPRRL